MNKENKPYYLGLDIGTNSVGWAVTDGDYNLCKFRKKDMWGIRLFESAETAEQRRLKRNERRRLDRKKQRIDMLQMIFAEEMSKIDNTFFLRLNESRLHKEDKSINVKYPIFNDPDYLDIDYYNEYPTIYHLRKELIDSNSEHDIRLVYLALHHLIKHRGHFLIDGSLSDAKDFNITFDTFVMKVFGEFSGIEVTDREKFEEILKDKDKPNSKKQKELRSLFLVNEEEREAEDVKIDNLKVAEICKLIVGNKGDFKKILRDIDEIDDTSFKISEEEKLEKFIEALYALKPDDVSVPEGIKLIYDWSILSSILDGYKTLSEAKVDQYDVHKENLYLLRGIILKYCTKEQYHNFFNDRNGKSNYAAYIGFVKKNGKKHTVKKCSVDAFYTELSAILAGIKCNDEDDLKTIETLKAGAKAKSLLPLQRTKENSVIPKQVNEIELRKILKNARGYLDFLNSEDNGISIVDKIISIFNYRIPYYVGPLSKRHEEEGSNSWIVRKAEGYIYPWNFEEKVDLAASNEKFIERMTNKCTYVFGEDVIPKNSLLYSKYMVLNELNNLTVRGKKITVELKQEIFNNLFKFNSKVTGKKLLTYLRKYDSELVIEDLGGFDQNFSTSLTSYLDFKKQVFGERIEEDRIRIIVEDIIRWITIYGDDKKMLQNVIEAKYPGELNDNQIKAVKKLKYSGWGNFSKMFLTGFEDINDETGEYLNIMQALWVTNNNLMQILSNKFTYSEQINSYNKNVMGRIDSISYDELIKDMYVSPANKRAIWQTVQIAEEVKRAMGYEPDKIFIEMARQKEVDKKRTKSRKEQLIELYNACEGDLREWADSLENGLLNRDERQFNSKKLYLYYTQMGRSMYTGKEIDLDELMTNNSKWDIDHIYPQSLIKDDSLDNMVLVEKTFNNNKDNEPLSLDIQKKMIPLWKKLLAQKLISKKKYDRLTRTGEFTEDELSGFLNRQLVETRQSTKAVADLFGSIYSSRIVYVKANNVSDFRKNELAMLKSRRVNDYHHAKDAYLNIVVGNVYDCKFTKNWVRENKGTNYSINKVFWFDVWSNGKKVWKAPDRAVKAYPDEKMKLVRNEAGGATGGTIDVVRKTMSQNNILYTEYTYCEKGELFNATYVNKNGNSSIELKKGLSLLKYGGYNSAKNSYFALIEFDGKKGERIRQIIGVPIYIDNILEQNANAFEEYCNRVKGLNNVIILRNMIKKNSLIVVDGYPLRIRGESKSDMSFKNNLQLVVDNDMESIIRHIEKYQEKEIKYPIKYEFDGFNDDMLIALYDTLIEKLIGPYLKRPANKGNDLNDKRNCFIALPIEDKVVVISEIIDLLRCDNKTTANMKLLGMGPSIGNIAVNKNTLGKANLVLVNQSVTGLFVNRIKL